MLIKYFRNIAGIDLNALFPDVRVVLSLADKLLLSGPALVGGVPVLLKLVSSLTVLFLVIGFYFGLSASAAEDETAGALAALSGLAALGGFIMRQWLRYQRQSLKYQKELTENVYFRNVNNNAGIFDAMIGTAEDQECKEAFLAYYFLATAAGPPGQAGLEAAVEGLARPNLRGRGRFQGRRCARQARPAGSPGTGRGAAGGPAARGGAAQARPRLGRLLQAAAGPGDVTNLQQSAPDFAPRLVVAG